MRSTLLWRAVLRMEAECTTTLSYTEDETSDASIDVVDDRSHRRKASKKSTPIEGSGRTLRSSSSKTVRFPATCGVHFRNSSGGARRVHSSLMWKNHMPLRQHMRGYKNPCPQRKGDEARSISFLRRCSHPSFPCEKEEGSLYNNWA